MNWKEKIFGKKASGVSADESASTAKGEKSPEYSAKKGRDENEWQEIAPKNTGKLDMVIAFDTTGSMSRYIDDVRMQVAELIPVLFQDNDDLRLGIVAFGDYCDMSSTKEFGIAYQCLEPTNKIDDIVYFVRYSRDTSGGDADEFYELVIKKIVEETPWREESTRAVLLISDSKPHPLGYTYKKYVVNNQIDWRQEAQKAAEKKIRIDTVTINDLPWYHELSEMTNGVCVPFSSSDRTSRLVRASVYARGSVKQRMYFAKMMEEEKDREMKSAFSAYDYTRRHDFGDEYSGKRVTPEFVKYLKPDEIFVFGSNIEGKHDGGAAGYALKYFGAVYGRAEGIQGHSYAIPTVGVSKDEFAEAVMRFCQFAKAHPELTFLVTAVGCGNAGGNPRDIARYFYEASMLKNVKLPEEFWFYL